jgi:hypothetical protein
MATRLAPIYHALFEQRRKVQVRLPDPEQVKYIRLMLTDPFIFAVNIFDKTLGALLSDEDRFTTAEDFWWVGTTTSFSAGGPTSPPFAVQFFHSVNVGQADEFGQLHMQKPVNSQNFFGTAQQPAYLKVPKLFRKNTEIICGVQNLQNAANIIQVVMLGYMGEPVGGLT